MNKFITDILTGIDNDTYDIIRVTFLSAIVMFYIFEAFEVFVNHNFNETEYFGAMSAFFVSTAGALLIKKTTEPEGKKE